MLDSHSAWVRLEGQADFVVLVEVKRYLYIHTRLSAWCWAHMVSPGFGGSTVREYMYICRCIPVLVQRKCIVSKSTNHSKSC